ncbi:MAG: uroporphyrinogen-III synthase [Candidatus Binataceae bacterium]|nr:uroporphyrinogen-III synthase [Candidatus Binataceae bacterium]
MAVSNLALNGRTIVVTRAAGPAAERFSIRLRAMGATVIEFPTIAIAPPDSYQTLDRAIARLGAFDWIVFTSANGVAAFFERLMQQQHHIDEARARFAAIGPATAHRLRKYGIEAAAIPAEYRAEAIIDAIGADRIRGARFLIPRAQVAREVLPEMLLAQGAAEVIVAPVYRTIVPDNPNLELLRAGLNGRKIDLITFTSSSTVLNFQRMVEAMPPGLKAAVIGPITEETARRMGFEVAISAAEYTIDGLAAAISDWFKTQPML